MEAEIKTGDRARKISDHFPGIAKALLRGQTGDSIGA